LDVRDRRIGTPKKGGANGQSDESRSHPDGLAPQIKGSVTAPKDALVTVRAYFARTPFR
jgi:hypothetical protein